MITVSVEGSLGSVLLRFVSRGMMNTHSLVTLLRSHRFRFCASSIPAIPGALSRLWVQEREEREHT